jgi:hypothetical protein
MRKGAREGNYPSLAALQRRLGADCPVQPRTRMAVCFTTMPNFWVSATLGNYLDRVSALWCSGPRFGPVAQRHLVRSYPTRLPFHIDLRQESYFILVRRLWCSPTGTHCAGAQFTLPARLRVLSANPARAAWSARSTQGNRVAPVPPHRSERARFGHSAPTSGV